MIDLTRGTTSRFSFDPRIDTNAVWAPDGGRVAFASSRNGKFDLFEKPASSATDERPLLVTDPECGHTVRSSFRGYDRLVESFLAEAS